MAGQNLLQSLRVLFGLFKMLLKSARQFFITGCLCQLGQCFYELLFCAEKIFQLMNIKIFESTEFHGPEFVRKRLIAFIFQPPRSPLGKPSDHKDDRGWKKSARNLDS